MTGLSSVYGLVGVNSKCGVQSKGICESQSCVCIAGFSACGCRKKSAVHETLRNRSAFRQWLQELSSSYRFSEPSNGGSEEGGGAGLALIVSGTVLFFFFKKTFCSKKYVCPWGASFFEDGTSGGVCVPCIYTHARSVRVTVGDSGLRCCTCVTYFER